MKVLLSIFTLAVYLLGSLGTTFNIHLCEGRFVNIMVQVPTSNSSYDCCETTPVPEETSTSCCDKNTTTESHSKDCNKCSNIQLIVKADKTQILSTFNFAPEFVALLPISVSYFTPITTSIYSALQSIPQYAQPPPGLWQNRTLFSLYQNRKLDC